MCLYRAPNRICRICSCFWDVDGEALEWLSRIGGEYTDALVPFSLVEEGQLLKASPKLAALVSPELESEPARYVESPIRSEVKIHFEVHWQSRWCREPKFW